MFKVHNNFEQVNAGWVCPYVPIHFSNFQCLGSICTKWLKDKTILLTQGISMLIGTARLVKSPTISEIFFFFFFFFLRLQ